MPRGSMVLPAQLFCAIRKRWVSKKPEELVRQALIQKMLTELGYPREQMMVEAKLSDIPHLDISAKGRFPNRRADLLCFSKEVHPDYPLYPLLLVECKAIPLSVRSIHQLIGYNYLLKAPYIALANQTELRFGWYDFQNKTYKFLNQLPPYITLKENIKYQIDKDL